MSPTPRLWPEVVGPYRAAEWHECIRLARTAVDEDPHDLTARFLLSRLYLKVEDLGLAQLQCERLLPLAVGQGDLFTAIAAQKCLDGVPTGAARHAKRYAAMHQWFHSIRRRKRGDAPHPERLRITPGDLIRMTPERFSRIAEDAAVQCLDLEPRDLDGSEGALWVVIYGRVRAYLESAEPGRMEELVLGPGESLCCVPGTDVTLVRLIPELPTECLAFDPEILVEIAPEVSPEDEAPPPVAAATATPHPPEPAERPTLAMLREELAAASDPAVEAGPPATTPQPRAVAPVPVPDPIAEPLIAMGAPIERRQETRVAISLEDRTAMLGLAGTRVAPIRGVLHSLSAADIVVGFRRAELLPLRLALHGAVVRVQIALAGRAVLHLAARMAWMDAAPPSPEIPDPDEAALTLEFLSVSEMDRARIGDAVTPSGGSAGLRRAA